MPSPHGESAAEARPTVSVCMPAHRNSAYFRAALRSVLDQTFEDFEVVVTDDSGGDLRSAVEAVNDPRVRYFANPEPLGFAGNHCRAIRCSTGRFVGFLHDDDLWRPDYLTCAVAALSEDDELGMVITAADEIDCDGAYLNTRPTEFVPGRQPETLAAILHRREMMLLPSATLVRREALRDNTFPWPDVVAADMTMYVDLARAGWGLFYLDLPLIEYRMHNGQIGMDDYAHRHALVTVWDRYEFTGSNEDARRERLAGALVGRAGAAVKRGWGRQSRRDLAQAIRTDRTALATRTLVLFLLSFVPRGSTQWVHRQWSRVHDPVATRHAGT